MAVVFSYTHPDVDPKKGKQPALRRLRLRLNPNSVNWNYNVNTQSYDTYGGQVLQVLSINIDRLVIEGQLGREGPFGVTRTPRTGKNAGPRHDPRWKGSVPRGGFVTNSVTEQFNYNKLYPGLHAMVEFFREYFAIMSQGADADQPGRYLQIPMSLTYGAGPSHEDRTWKIIPYSFPNFRRSNENFAPEWRVEAHVVEADGIVLHREKQAAIQRIQDKVGYQARNPFSDPLADPATDTVDITRQIASQFRELLPKFTQGELQDMIWQNISVPNATTGRPIDPTLLGEGEILQGEQLYEHERKREKREKLDTYKKQRREVNRPNKSKDHK